tara:strand:- start:12706 stop:13104 length:399 start_codon:yes stop_codon:yes gene_type:complete
MKAKTFENLIRKVVREEIDYSLRREIKSLKEDLRSELKPTIVEQTEKQVEPIQVSKNTLREKIMGTQSFKPQSYTSNSALNDLLNETAQGSTNTETATAPGIPVESMPAPVQDVVNRDYRGLMQAIEKKKGR